MNKTTDNELFKNLQALEDASFPKACDGCGAQFNNEKEYIQKTQAINENSGLAESKDQNGQKYLKLTRRCICGKSILDHFGDRRDVSNKGDLRRNAFEKVVLSLIAKGLNRSQARSELINHLSNKKSLLLEKMGIFNR